MWKVTCCWLAMCYFLNNFYDNEITSCIVHGRWMLHCVAFHFLKDNYHAYRFKFALSVIEFQITSNYQTRKNNDI